MEGSSAAGFDISGALLADGDFTKVNFKESQLSKVLHPTPHPHAPALGPAPRPSPTPQSHTAARAWHALCLRRASMRAVGASAFEPSGLTWTPQVWAPGANFAGADFTNGVIDRAYFKGANFKGAIFGNAVLSGSTFEDTNLENTDFTDAYLGDFDQRKLCKNPTLTGENPVTGAPTRGSAGCPQK